jgi:alanine dehydrogenase
VELSLTDIMDKIVVDDWGQCRTGRFGSLRAHVDTGRLSEENLHAELAQIVVGDRPGSRSWRWSTCRPSSLRPCA